MNRKSPHSWRQATKLVRGGLDRSKHGETAEAIFMNSGFTYPDAETAAARFSGDADGFVYGRYGNPTVEMFEQRMCLLEGSEACYATASGMAAVFGALAAQVSAGDHIVSSRALFGSCFQVVSNILPRFGIECTIVDGRDIDAWRAAITPQTKLVFLETPSNPMLEVTDIAAVSEIAHKAGASVVIDNVFATPVLQKPLELGADVVAYSGTKHIDGQGRCLGGAIMSTEEFKEEKLKPFLRHTGPSLSPFNAWILLKGLETLQLRVEKQGAAALEIAQWLSDQSAVKTVLYPHMESHPQVELCRSQMSGGGTMVTFEIDGARDRVFDIMRRLEIIDISNNLGDSKSLVTHPASTTHYNLGEEGREKVGITDAMLRLSVGLEDIEDLKDDLEAAFVG